ncbi:hypothetical protein POM88_008524 [Heracleum sosnowskyi]|uniref:Aminotransferase-like plant mobile domain-containing protein n=1 Tax=Heracleum sosnowskyi TaxID=360622 RepID=A0AAD8J7J8_9APIA|nr:hypothetical protein POM88_008524 [Heracleum sosnowskyi]
MNQGPRDPSLLHLQSMHRSKEVWRVGGGDTQRCQRHNPNQTGLPALDHCMLPILSAGPNMTWPKTVGSIFGHVPEPKRFNGSRLQLSWFASIAPHSLPQHASGEELRHYTRCYLIQLFGGSLFTDHSGAMIHCMWVHFVRDLDVVGRYAWGPVVLAFLYRELFKGSKVDTEEVAKCLLLLQLWVWERFPTLAPIRTTQPLVHDHFWAGQLSGPLGVRWLVGHSFLEKEPYPSDVIDSLHPYCLDGSHLWRYRGPMICVFIVEPHFPDKVARQFDLIVGDDTVPEYLERTVRFISRVGALHFYLGGLLSTIADRIRSVLPDVFLLATEGLRNIDHCSLYDFEAFSVEGHRDKEKEGSQNLGRRPKRGGKGGGRPSRPRHRVGGGVDQVVPPTEVEDEIQGQADNVATNLGDDHDDPLVHEGSHTDGVHFDVPEPPVISDPPTIVQPTVFIAESTRQPVSSHFIFDLGLTPTPQPIQQQPIDAATTDQPPVIQRTHRPPHNLICSYPTFDLGITPPSDDGVTSSQSTQSSKIPLTQASDVSVRS